MLTAIGLYGVLLYSVSRRTREIGLRMALGAKPSDIARLVGRHSVILIGSGVFAGRTLLLRDAATRVISGSRNEHTDPAAFVTVIAVLAAVALIAVLPPVTRALRVDPMTALRYRMNPPPAARYSHRRG